MGLKWLEEKERKNVMKLKLLAICFVFVLISSFCSVAKAVSDDEILLGFCSTLMPGFSYAQKVTVCKQQGNQRICKQQYSPETIKSCRNMFEQMGLLKPGESPKVLFNTTNPQN